jgi:hypothetical protein
VTDASGWFVFAHLAGLVVFVAAHGVSTFAAFGVRAQRDPRTVAVLLATSKRAMVVAYGGLLLLLVGGFGAAISTGVLDRPWVVGSIALLVAVAVAMYAIATRYYVELRQVVGDGLERGTDDSPVVDRAALAASLDTRRPEILLAVGGVGLLVIVWLMVFKPG